MAATASSSTPATPRRFTGRVADLRSVVEGTWRESSLRRKRIIVAVAGVGVLAFAATAAAVQTEDDDYFYDDETFSASAEQTPNEACAEDVYNAAADMVNNGNTGYMRQLAVGGNDNPVYMMATQVSSVFQSAVYTEGRLDAQFKARAEAVALCERAGNPNNDAFGGTGYTAPVD